MKNNNTFKMYIAPVIVLVCICLVVTAALAATYGVTQPIIDKNTKASADAARQELLPDADSFTAVDSSELVVLEEGKVFATECYVADNGSGMVVTVQSSSFGGLLTEMIGIDKDGAITGVQVTAHDDTPGLGTKAQTTELQSTSAKDDSSVNYITGATISSNAVHYGVYCALEQYKALGGVQ